MAERYIQVGTVGFREPRNPYKIIKCVPIYAKADEELQAAEKQMCSDRVLSRMLADMFKQYIKGKPKECDT